MDGVVKLQALVRGYIVRKKFKKLRGEYVELVMSLEDNSKQLQVSWKSKEKPCFPSISSAYSKGKTNCESVTDSVGKQGQGIVTCLKIDVPVVNITQISNSGTSTEIENCEFDGDCVSEKTLGVAQDIRELPGLQSSLAVSLSTYPKDKTELMKLKEDLEMELLWIQQAMKSRENYLITKKHLQEK